MFAFPTAAVSAAATSNTDLYFSAGKVKGYRLNGRANLTDAYFQLVKQKKNVYQSHGISTASETEVKYSAKADLSSAKLSASLGSAGKLTLHFKATGKKKKQVPAGCHGDKVSARRGVVTGTIKARLDRHFFTTIVRTKPFPGTLTEAAPDLCDEAPFGTGERLRGTRIVDATSHGLKVTYSLPRAGQAHEFADFDNVKPGVKFILSHDIIASGPRTGFTMAADNSSARLTGFSPFSGPLVYASPAQSPSGTTGTVGGVKVKFDSIGVKSIPKGGPAELFTVVR